MIRSATLSLSSSLLMSVGSYAVRHVVLSVHAVRNVCENERS